MIGETTALLLPIATWILFASLKSVAIIPLVLLIRRIFAKWLTPQGRYGLWFAAIACLAIPFGAQVNIRNDSSAAAAPEHVQVSTQASVANHEQPIVTIGSATEESASRIPPRTMAVLIWLLGVAGLATAVLYNTARYARIRSAASGCDALTNQLLEDCKQALAIRRAVRLLETSQIDSPLLVGYWQPTLLLPRNLSAQVGSEQLRLVLMHELTHMKRHDILVNWVITLVQIAHWFNPLAWYALRVARHDMEQACDASVLRHLTAAERFDYGNTLIRLSDITPQRALLVQNASVIESPSQLKARISMIAQFRPGRPASSILSAVLIALISVVAITQAANAPPQPTPAPSRASSAAATEQNAPALQKVSPPQARSAVGTSAQATRPPAATATQRAADLPVLETAFFQIRYATAKDLAAFIKSAPGIGLLSPSGSIAVDERSNTLVIKDDPGNIAAIRQLIANLDVPVQQVLLSGQFVMVEEDLIQELRASIPGNNRGLPAFSLGTDGAAVAVLEAGVRAGRAEVISTPRWIMANHVKTSIEQSVDLQLLPGEVPNPLARKMLLRLGLTPQLLPDTRIALDVDAKVDRLGSVIVTTSGQAVPSIDTTQTTTQVLLDSGATVMLDIADQLGPGVPRSGQRRRLVAFVTLTPLSGNPPLSR